MHRDRFGVEPVCRTLGVSASAYYQRATGQRSQRAVEDERLLELIEQTHAANYCAYGYRRTWKALLRSGEKVGRDRVKRLMRANGIQGAKRRGKPWRTTIPDPAATGPPDLVNRDFTAAGLDRLWVADFCYLRCWEGLVFFSFVIDVFSRRVVGWQFAAHMRTDLVLDALRMALATRKRGADVKLVHHSDAGSQLRLNRSSQHWLIRGIVGAESDGFTWPRRDARGAPPRGCLVGSDACAPPVGPVPDGGAGSGHHSQVLVQRLGGGPPAECLSRPAVERGGDRGEVLGAVP
jgi:putative transposase